jgi:hypothetical protein
MSGSLTNSLSALQNAVVAMSSIAQKLTSMYASLPTQQLAQVVATTGFVKIYSATSAAASHLNTIAVCNTTGGAVTITLCIVPSGGTAAAGNAIYFGTSVAANTTLTWTGAYVIPAGGSVQVLASAATSLTVTLAGGSFG